MDATTKRSRILLSLTALSVLAAFLVPSAPQPASYHDFADRRILYGIANALDVSSNLGFLLAGIAGLWIVMHPGARFDHAHERWPYAVFFSGVLLTALGSGYYHLAPDNERLFWDRLPMTIAFMSLLAAQVGDRIDPRAGRALLLPMLAIGAASVVYWRATERMGIGNAVPYGILQGYSVVVLLLIALWLPSRYTRGNDVYWVFACYVVAKFAELLDAQILALGNLVSGHTLKHLAAAAGALVVCRMLARRVPMQAPVRSEPLRRPELAAEP